MLRRYYLPSPGVGLVASLLVALVVSACGGATAPQASPAATSAPSQAAASTPAPTTRTPVDVTVAFNATIAQAMFYEGQNQGIYLKHGINLKLMPLSSATAVIQAVGSGQANLGAGVWVGILPAIETGLPLRIAFMNQSRPDVLLYDRSLSVAARGDLNLKSVSEVKGLKVGVPFGGGLEEYGRASLAAAGLDPNKDVQLVNVTLPNLQGALQTKSIDVAVSGEPFTSELIQKMGAKVLQRGGGYSDGRVFLFATSTWAQSQAAVLEDFVAASAHAAQYTRQNLDQAAKTATSFLPGTEATILRSALNYMDFDPRWSSYIEQGFTKLSEGLIAKGKIKAAPTVKSALLPVVDGIEKKYPEYFSDLK